MDIRLKRADITNFRFHDLRHTCASWLLQNGANLVTVKKILGHAKIQTTMRYAHLENNVTADALSTLTTQLRHSDSWEDNQGVERK